MLFSPAAEPSLSRLPAQIYAVYAETEALRATWLTTAIEQLKAWADDFIGFDLRGERRPSERLKAFEYEHGGVVQKPPAGALEHVLEVVGPVEQMLGLVGSSAKRAKRNFAPAYGQVPHIDLFCDARQITLALTAKAVPTLVYQGSAQVRLAELAQLVGRPPAQLAWDNVSSFRQLTLARETLLSGLLPAVSSELDVGDAIIMRGGVVHARPRVLDA